jgi:hypothetical protein
MNPRVEKVFAKNDFTLLVVFKNNEQKLFDMKPYLEIGVFKALKMNSLFFSVRAENGSVVWNDTIDFDPDTLYLEGTKIETT